jgi:hypothetical protein
MIVQINRGKDFRATLHRLFNTDNPAPPNNPELVGGNIHGDDSHQLAEQFNRIRQLRPDIPRPLWHASLYLGTAEHLDNDTWCQLTKDFLEQMEFSPKIPYVAIRHKDSSLDHIHIILSRIGIDAKIWRQSWDALKAIQITHTLERTYGLTQFGNDPLDIRRESRRQNTQSKLTHREIKKSQRTSGNSGTCDPSTTSRTMAP